jgi:hypothetical protein
MLQDQSPDKIETMNFLERHLGDFQTTGSVRPSVNNVSFFFHSLILNLIQISKSLSDTAQVASGLFTVVCKKKNKSFTMFNHDFCFHLGPYNDNSSINELVVVFYYTLARFYRKELHCK